MKTTNKAPIMGIDRLRVETDGNGITTLVTFYGCPLKCKYCLNPQCHAKSLHGAFMLPQEVFDMIAIDELYYLATGGGITFGGGEPLLYSDFIIEVLEHGTEGWNITIETSLNVSYERVSVLLPYINHIIVDIKDINPHIYELYTQSSNEVVIENLKQLSNSDFLGNVLVRVPLINGYNSRNDIQKSKHFLEELGYSNFDFFEYKTEFRNDRKR